MQSAVRTALGLGLLSKSKGLLREGLHLLFGLLSLEWDLERDPSHVSTLSHRNRSRTFTQCIPMLSRCTLFNFMSSRACLALEIFSFPCRCSSVVEKWMTQSKTYTVNHIHTRVYINIYIYMRNIVQLDTVCLIKSEGGIQYMIHAS